MGCFYFLIAANNVLIYYFLCGHVFIGYTLGYILRSWVAGSYVTLYLASGETVRSFFKAAALFYIPTSNIWGLWFLYIFTNTYNLSDFLSRTDLLSVECYLVVLICISLIFNDVKHFSWTYRSFVYLFWRNVFSNPLLILKRIICPF